MALLRITVDKIYDLRVTIFLGLHYQRKLCGDPGGRIEKKPPAAELKIRKLYFVTPLNVHLQLFFNKA